MSKALLESFEGRPEGPFLPWHRALRSEPRIAWYPSAGRDFRDLLYLSREFATLNPGVQGDVPEPDLFLHTDWTGFPGLTSRDGAVLFDDTLTRLTIEDSEMVYRPEPDPETVPVRRRRRDSRSALFLRIKVESDVLGVRTWPVIYSFGENTAFCHDLLLPTAARISHVVHVRYGTGWYHHGPPPGSWLPGVLGRLRTECFVTDGHHLEGQGDERGLDAFPALRGGPAMPPLELVRTLPGIEWSNHGDVSWYRVGR